MTKRAPAKLSVSVHQLLLNKARKTNCPFNELLQYFSMERFLYRLSKSSYGAKFILEGALMFTAWEPESYRPTMDIDLLGKTSNDLAALVEIVKEICAQPVESDGLTFNPDTVKGTRITEVANYQGIRIRLQANLGRARVIQQLDIGFRDVVAPGPQPTDCPTLLDFPAPKVRGYGKESIVTEEFEPLVTLGILNSRMKDYFDIWILSRKFDFDRQTLCDAIAKTFSNRGTIIVREPVGLTATFAKDPSKKAQWRGFIRKSRLVISASLEEVVADIRGFLEPVTKAIWKGQFHEKWTAPGPWHRSG